MSNIKKEDLINYLKELGIKEISKEEMELVVQLIKRNQTLPMLKKELELLRALNEVLLTSYTEVSLTNMMKINDDIDNDLLVKLFFVYEQIKSKGLNKEDTLIEFKKVTMEILANNKKTNFAIGKMISEEINELKSVKNVLYFGMLNKKNADKLISNCIDRSKTFLDYCDMENLSMIIGCLKKDFNLSDEDILKISNECATFFAFSSANKLKNIHQTLQNLKDYISTGLSNSNEYEKFGKLLDRDFKEMLFNSSSLFNSASESINDTVRFLMGEKLGEITANARRDIASLKGEFTPSELAKIYKESLTSLTINVNKVASVCDNLSFIYKKQYNLDLNLEGLINGRNFSGIAQLKNEDYKIGSKAELIFGILKPFLGPEEMENLLKNNLTFLIANPSQVKKSIRKAILQSNNISEYKKNVLEKINNHFDMYESMDKDIQRSQGVVVSKPKKVLLNDLQEEELSKILYALGSSDGEIDEWKNNWNNDEKELINMTVEEDLKTILSELSGLLQMINGEYTDIKDFMEENIAVESLMNDLLERRDEIVSKNKLNKTHKKINAQIEDTLVEITKRKDYNIEIINDYYQGQLRSLNEKLSLVSKDKQKYEDNLKQLQKIKDEIARAKISEETVENDRKKIDDFYKFLEKGEKILASSNKLDKSINETVEKFFISLESNKNDRILQTKYVENLLSTDNRYKDSMYMFSLFVHILVKEGLVYEDVLNELGDKKEIREEDRNMEYYSYRLLLNDEQVKFSDKIRNDYIKDREVKRTLFESLMSKLEEDKVDVSDIHTTKKALSISYKLANAKQEQFYKNRELLTQQKNLSSEIDKTKIEEIDEEISRLNFQIAEYSKAMDSWNSKKSDKK